MLEWVHVAAAVVASAGVVVIILWLFRRICTDSGENGKNRAETSQIGFPKNHNYQKSPYRRQLMNYYVFPRRETVFSWADHPSLITDAVENGWSRFAFSSPGWSSPVIRAAALLGPCMAAAGDMGLNRVEMESSWEICQESAEFLQKLRVNPGLKKQNTGHCSIAKAALPLPGPPLGNSSFPQEAYFEMTILSSSLSQEDENRVHGEVEEMKENCCNPNGSNGKAECVINIDNSHVKKMKMEEMKLCGRDGREKEAILLSIGLSTGGSSSSVVPWKVPSVNSGSSIGFVSDGSVWLRGEKMVAGSDNTMWGSKSDIVIGCGYNPIQKQVLFTVDSECVHVVQCKTEEFGAPLYPTIWGNGGLEVTVLINFGQSPFRYGQANVHRTPNPCFIGKKSSSVGYEDSKELFSMGKIDPQWLNRAGTKTGPKKGADHEESDGDLFEIRLEKCSGRSPIN